MTAAELHKLFASPLLILRTFGTACLFGGKTRIPRFNKFDKEAAPTIPLSPSDTEKRKRGISSSTFLLRWGLELARSGVVSPEVCWPMTVRQGKSFEVR
jgi:hypothetical protein